MNMRWWPRKTNRPFPTDVEGSRPGARRRRRTDRHDVRGSLNLGKFMGIQVRAHWMFLVLFYFFLMTMELEQALFVLIGVFGSVFLHELGHSLVSKEISAIAFRVLASIRKNWPENLTIMASTSLDILYSLAMRRVILALQ